MRAAFDSAARILLVSSSPFLRTLTRGMLRDAGCQCADDVSTLQEARARLQAAHFDLAIADIELDDGTGIELLKSIRSAGRAGTASMPVILLGSLVSRRLLMRAVREGADDVLVKPFSQRTLVAHVTRALCDKRPFVRRRKYVGPLPRPPLLRYLQQYRGHAGTGKQRARLRELVAGKDADGPFLL